MPVTIKLLPLRTADATPELELFETEYCPEELPLIEMVWLCPMDKVIELGLNTITPDAPETTVDTEPLGELAYALTVIHCPPD